MDHAEGIALWRPTVVVDRTRVSGGAHCRRFRVDLVDGDDFARLRFRQQLAIVKAPPRSRIAAEGAAMELGIRATPRAIIENAHFEHVAGLRMAHGDRARAD